MKKILIYLLLIFQTTIICGQDINKISQIQDDLKFLSSDKLEGRFTGTDGEKMAAEYIISNFEEFNLQPFGDSNSFIQKFNALLRLNPHSDIDNKQIIGRNVVGFYNNNARNTIIIGAHYDHLGYGEVGSLSTLENQIHNGADDNASGVALMINLIPELIKYPNYNYLFIAFSGEELGLYGSTYFAKNPTIELEKVRFMLNFDMVGRLNSSRTLLVNGVGTSSKWESLVEKSNIYDFDLKTTPSGFGSSDHTPFYNREIPVLHFFTGQHEDYHKPSDDIEKINFEGIYDVSKYVVNIIKNSFDILDFDYVETKSESNKTPRFSVTLGIMPDYLSEESGLRIDGVSKDKLADRVGILNGDVIVKLGEFDVTDIMTYMKALSNFKSGDKTIVVIYREDLKIEFDVIFD